MPPKAKSVSRISWLGSLRPNVTSLRPAAKPHATAAPTIAPHIERRPHALGWALACVAVVTATAAAWTSHSHSRGKPVQSIVSGRAGLRKTSSGASERWSLATVAITIDPTLAHATPAAREAILQAFGAWVSSDGSLPQLSFDTASTPGEAAQDGVNRLLLGPITIPGQKEDLAITISYAEADTGEIVEADTIFNSAYDWTSIESKAGKGADDDCHDRYDLQNVATHEAGHFFGLGEDYDDPSTTMYISSKPCQTSKRALTTSDVAVVSGLYAQPAAGSSQGTACGARIAGGRDTHGAAVVAMGVVALALARRNRRAK
jgi:hypothetical protein